MATISIIFMTINGLNLTKQYSNHPVNTVCISTKMSTPEKVGGQNTGLPSSWKSRCPPTDLRPCNTLTSSSYIHTYCDVCVSVTPGTDGPTSYTRRLEPVTRSHTSAWHKWTIYACAIWWMRMKIIYFQRIRQMAPLLWRLEMVTNWHCETCSDWHPKCWNTNGSTHKFSRFFTLHNPRRFRENCLGTFRLILLTGRQTDKH